VNPEKRKALEEAGFAFGGAADFLDAVIPMTIAEAAERLNVSVGWLVARLVSRGEFGGLLMSGEMLARVTATIDAERDGAIEELARLTEELGDDENPLAGETS
jgi:hypothetical protein